MLLVESIPTPARELLRHCRSLEKRSLPQKFSVGGKIYRYIGSVCFPIYDCLKLPHNVFGKRRLLILANQLVDSGAGSAKNVSRGLRSARAPIDNRRGEMLLLTE